MPYYCVAMLYLGIREIKRQAGMIKAGLAAGLTRNLP
jgi:hypothetical protein